MTPIHSLLSFVFWLNNKRALRRALDAVGIVSILLDSIAFAAITIAYMKAKWYVYIEAAVACVLLIVYNIILCIVNKRIKHDIDYYGE